MPWISGVSGKPLTVYTDVTQYQSNNPAKLTKLATHLTDHLAATREIRGERIPDWAEDDNDHPRVPERFEPPIGLKLRTMNASVLSGERMGKWDGSHLPVEFDEEKSPILTVMNNGVSSPSENKNFNRLRTESGIGGILLWDEGEAFGRKLDLSSPRVNNRPRFFDLTPENSERIKNQAIKNYDCANQEFDKFGVCHGVILQFDSDYDVIKEKPELAPPGFDHEYLADRIDSDRLGVQDHFAWTVRYWYRHIGLEESRIDCLELIEDLKLAVKPLRENTHLWRELQNHWEELQNSARLIGHNSKHLLDEGLEIDFKFIRIHQDITFWQNILLQTEPLQKNSLENAITKANSWVRILTTDFIKAIKDVTIKGLATSLLAFLATFIAWLTAQLF